MEFLDSTKKSFKSAVDGTKAFFKNIKESIGKTIDNIDDHTNPKVGLYAHKVFKYWTLAMFLIIIPLTPILIASFGFTFTSDSYNAYGFALAGGKITESGENFAAFLNSGAENAIWVGEFLVNHSVISAASGENGEFLATDVAYIDLSWFNEWAFYHSDFASFFASSNAYDSLLGWLKGAAGLTNAENIPSHEVIVNKSVYTPQKMDWALGFGVSMVVITIWTSIMWFWFSKFESKK